MIQDSIFRAYDIRGKYPSEINGEVVSEIVSKFFSNMIHDSNSMIRVVVGHDARISSPSLYEAAMNGIKNQESRIMIMPIGMSTTPELYFLVNKHDADVGIMITASHNPKEYNGIKFVGKKAKPISGKDVFNEIKNNLKF